MAKKKRAVKTRKTKPKSVSDIHHQNVLKELKAKNARLAELLDLYDRCFSTVGPLARRLTYLKIKDVKLDDIILLSKIANAWDKDPRENRPPWDEVQ